MVTPLRDGMNLVAKEYVAAQDAEDPGVLVLSQFAGAAEEMTEALIVNPYNIEATADVIRTALEMPLAERRSRHAALLAAVCKHDITSWSQSFLSQLERMRSDDDPAGWRSPEPIRAALERLGRSRSRSSRRRDPAPASARIIRAVITWPARKSDEGVGFSHMRIATDCPADRKCAAASLRRDGTDRVLPDRRAGGAGSRCDAVRQRRFDHPGRARAVLPPGASADPRVAIPSPTTC